LLTPPAKVRVLQTDRSNIVRWCDEWVDPCWDVEVVERHPQLDHIRSLWVYGRRIIRTAGPSPSILRRLA
ncbi:hypothetical protein, partial [Burkholderia sp. SIMBA_019]|uniref:hypothetical protein n=1 Tax=Burkholderia sp. SIMBA_019 TaxID=3085765 RepID=UPI0039780A39